MSLVTTAKAIRRARPLAQQKAIAASGENPMTGKWWPSWRPWYGVTDRVRSIFTRWSKGPNGTGAQAARAQAGTPKRLRASRLNGKRAKRPRSQAQRPGSKVYASGSIVRPEPPSRAAAEPHAGGRQVLP